MKLRDHFFLTQNPITKLDFKLKIFCAQNKKGCKTHLAQAVTHKRPSECVRACLFTAYKQRPLDCALAVRTLCKYCMATVYTLRFNFTTITNTQAIDALVYALSVMLFVNHKIESTQPRDDSLEFESSKDCLFAQLVLSSDSRYTMELL
jgi:hypothetical protein